MNDLKKEKSTTEEETAAYKKALNKVCADLGMDVESYHARKESRTDVEKRMRQMVQLDLGTIEVAINGHVYTGKVVVPEPVADDIMSMASNKRQRILKEAIRHEYQLEQLNSGGFQTRLVKTEMV